MTNEVNTRRIGLLFLEKMTIKKTLFECMGSPWAPDEIIKMVTSRARRAQD
jgi:hypothetical protein